VAKVETLVHTVELFGIGRYNDINKLETLVHTTIMPLQQRKRKLVPQMLLDKVLVVNVFWSQYPTKLHGRHKA